MLGTTFQIGRSALAAYQAAISIVGQNIANVGNPDYTRQTGRLSALYGGPVLGGVAPGAGVRLAELQRHIDEALEGRLRFSLAARAGAEQTYRALSQVESLYNELTDQDLSTGLTEFFGSFATLQTSPTEMTSRNLVLTAAADVIRTFERQRSALVQQMTDLNEDVSAAVRRANGIADEIARLNETVVAQEAGGQSIAGALRDRRDALLRELAETLEIQVRQQDNDSINVYVGSEPLVEFNRSRGLTVETVLEDGYETTQVRFADNNGSVVLRSGRLAGIVEARDTHLKGQIERLDQLARGLIYEVNRLHSTGRGLVGYTSLTGAYAVDDPAAVLNSDDAGLLFPIKNGTFIVHVRDNASGQVVTRQIRVDLNGVGGDDTTLASLAEALDGVPGLTASVTTDNRLKFEVAAGSEVWLSEDTSGALAALGIGAFFEGSNSANIAVRANVRQDPRLIAASLSGESGDGDNAGRLSALADTLSELLGNQSISDFHAATVSGLAVETNAALTAHEAADTVYSSLLAQRESVSGVSLDEEAINLAKFERSFQGAARYLGVLDALAAEVLALVE